MLPLLLALSMPKDLSDVIAKDAKLEQVVTGLQFTEGPAWTRNGELVFSDIPANKMYVLRDNKAEVYRNPSGNANGNIISPDGILYSACHGTRNIVGETKGAEPVVIADKFEGKKFHSPNDLVFRKNGDLYFTDPAYGLAGRPSEIDFKGVYFLKKGGTPVAVAKDFKTPNGIVFSPNEKICYVADCESQLVRAFDIASDGTFTNDRIFAQNIPANPDGMRVDTKGNVYMTAGKAVQIYAADGKYVGAIPVPETTTNCAWGDKDAKTLYITAGRSVYKIRTKIKGVRF